VTRGDEAIFATVQLMIKSAMDGREPGSQSRQNVVEIFGRFSEELDEHNDRRERLIKVRYPVNYFTHRSLLIQSKDQSRHHDSVQEDYLPLAPYRDG
jgi:hypothetical protein